MKKTSKKWLESIPKRWRPEIIDPCGWDTSNPEYSFNEEKISAFDFINRLGNSFIKGRAQTQWEKFKNNFLDQNS